ncbi:hypothetical protein Droror1_Dr00010294 [Drosera rotundifolia]
MAANRGVGGNGNVVKNSGDHGSVKNFRIFRLTKIGARYRFFLLALHRFVTKLSSVICKGKGKNTVHQTQYLVIGSDIWDDRSRRQCRSGSNTADILQGIEVNPISNSSPSDSVEPISSGNDSSHISIKKSRSLSLHPPPTFGSSQNQKALDNVCSIHVKIRVPGWS